MPFKAVAAAFCLALLLPDDSPAEVRQVDKSVFLTAVEAHMLSGNYPALEQPTLMGNFFHTGDAGRFIATVDGWLAGVVVDPGYLLATQGAGVAGFTQPAGWTGFSQSLVQSLENRYNGHIILARFDLDNPQDVVTATHEAIHAYAQATGKTALDSDDDGGPEFLSGKFITDLLPDLKAMEARHFEQAFKAAWDCRYDEVARIKSEWLTEIAEKRYIHANYSAHSRAVARDLLASWGGRIDWDGYEAFVETLGDDDTRDDC